MSRCVKFRLGGRYSYGRTRNATPWCTAPPVSRSSSDRPASSIAIPAPAASCTDSGDPLVVLRPP